MTREERDEYLRKYGHLPISGGSGEDDEPDDTDEDEDDEDEDDGTSGDDGKKRGKSSDAEAKFTQADVDRILQRRVKREVKKLMPSIRSQVEEEVGKKGTNATLEAQLAEANKKLGNYDTLEELVMDFEELAEQRFQDALKELPEFIQDMAPDDDAPALQKERWLVEKALPAKKKFDAAKKKGDSDDDAEDAAKRKSQRRGFNPPDPEKKGNKRQKAVDDLVKAYQSDRQYRRM